MSQKERRSSIRLNFINCHADYITDRYLGSAFISNMSDDGCFLEVSAKNFILPKIGSVVNIILYMPQLIIDAIPVKAVVKHSIWADKKIRGFGVEWDLLEATARDKILVRETKVYYREATLRIALKRIHNEMYGVGPLLRP